MIGQSAARVSQGFASSRIEGLLSMLEGRGQARAGQHSPPSVTTLCDVGEALAELGRGHRPRVALRTRLGDETVELGFERVGAEILVSAYSTGPALVVHAHERVVLAERALLLLQKELGRGQPSRSEERLLATLRLLEETLWDAGLFAEPKKAISLPSSEDERFSFGCEVWARSNTPSPTSGGSVLRSEMLPLMARGKMWVSTQLRQRDLPEVHVFFVAEKLAEMALEGLEASLRGRPLWRKAQTGGADIALRLVKPRGLGTREQVSVTLAPTTRKAPQLEGWTFASLELGDFARAVVDFGRGLARGVLRRDRGQSQNLRLVAFRARLREISEACNELDRDDALVNLAPESYRAFAKQAHQEARREQPGLATARLRYAPKWTAAVPAIDLRAMFLCGDSFLVGAAREVCSIERATGTIQWTRSVSKGVSVITPSGLARIDEAGQLALLDVASGETRYTLRLEPRVLGPVTGAVISAPGLPRMLVVSEGRKHLVGIDLDAGEVLWRLAARRGGTFRLKRAGRLVVVSGAETGLFAIDVVSGEIVWRYRDKLKFSGPASVVDDSLCAVAGEPQSTAGCVLHHLDPWSGAERWTKPLPAGERPLGPVLIGERSVIVPTFVAGGTSLVSYDRQTGELRHRRDACRGVSAPILVDDAVILNSESGELVAYGASDGEFLYRHVFSDGLAGDRPRRLEPVLRGGALFVPQASVQIVRPADGRLVGTIATDIVPDLLRVDERCDLYVAEESGHVAAYGAGPRLSLVR